MGAIGGYYKTFRLDCKQRLDQVGRRQKKINIIDLKTGQNIATPLLLTLLTGTKTIIQSQIHQQKTQIIQTPFMKR